MRLLDLSEHVKVCYTDNRVRYRVLINPSRAEYDALVRDFRCLRGLIDPDTGDLFVWAAYFAIHIDVCYKVGIEFLRAIMLEGCVADGDVVWPIRRINLRNEPPEAVVTNPHLMRLPVRIEVPHFKQSP